MLRANPVGSRRALGGAAPVELVTDVAALVRQIAEGIDDAIDEEVSREVADVVASAQAAWPVRTGLSRRLLGVGATHDPDDPRWRVQDAAPYAAHVHASGSKAPLLRTLLRGPLRERIPIALERAARRIGPAA